jgi:UDP-glucose 4-epimerase
MKALVVGGAGYIGGITARLLAEAGHEVTVFDNLSTGFEHNVLAKLIQGDICDKPAVDALFSEQFDMVIHFAGKLDVGESVQNPKLYFDNNVVGSLNIIDAFVAAGGKHFIFSSSATVYGEPDTVPIAETFPIQPINPYGYSKVMVEEMLESYGQTHALNWLALRYFNPVGAYKGIGQNPAVSNVVPAALRAVKTGQPLQIFGNDYDTPDGTCLRDYVAVEEIAQAHVMAAEKMVADTRLQTPINLGSGQGYSVMEILAALEKALGKPVPQKVVGRRQGDAPRSVASNQKAHELLGWKPAKSLDEMVASAVEWFLSKPLA